MQKSISLNDLDISGSRILAKNIAEKINQEILRVIYIKGDLGVGKTTLVRFILRELGIRQTVKSPSFSTVEFYNTDKFEIAHLDFFRASNPNFWRTARLYRDPLRTEPNGRCRDGSKKCRDGLPRRSPP